MSSFLLDNYLGVGLLDCMVSICITSYETFRVLFCTPTGIVGEFQFQCLLTSVFMLSVF